jgi:hypothetical protein
MESVLAELESSRRIYEWRGLLYSTFIEDPDFIERKKLTF